MKAEHIGSSAIMDLKKVTKEWKNTFEALEKAADLYEKECEGRVSKETIHNTREAARHLKDHYEEIQPLINQLI